MEDRTEAQWQELEQKHSLLNYNDFASAEEPTEAELGSMSEVATDQAKQQYLSHSLRKLDSHLTSESQRTRRV